MHDQTTTAPRSALGANRVKVSCNSAEPNYLQKSPPPSMHELIRQLSSGKTRIWFGEGSH